MVVSFLPSPLVLSLMLLPLLVTLYLLSTFLSLLLRQHLSPLRTLPGPPSPSFFMGNLREMHDQENTNLVPHWVSLYGSTFVYRGFLGGCRLMTVDPTAIKWILSRGYEFVKPDFVRETLASMAAGHEGLLTVEGEDHRRQRKILTPAFSASHIRSLSPIFWEKALQLRGIWLDIIEASETQNVTPPPPSDPLSPPTSPSPSNTSSLSSSSSPLSDSHATSSSKYKSRPNGPTIKPDLPLGTSTSFLLNPFASFTSSKIPSGVSATPSTLHQDGMRSRTKKDHDRRKHKIRRERDPEIPEPPSPSPFIDGVEVSENENVSRRDEGERKEGKRRMEGAKVDVLAWLARATLDVIGEAGFGYTFNSLSTASSGEGEENELARAFGIIFSTARKFRVITILQVWFPVLRRFRRNNATMKEAQGTMRRIGLELIEERKAEVLVEQSTGLASNDEQRTNGRDLLSVLIRSNLSSDASQRLELNEILCQISTFLAAGHETSASALTWTLYALARAPHVQTKLRKQLRELPITLPTPCAHCSSPTSASASPTSSYPSSTLFSSTTATSNSCPPLSTLQPLLSHPYLDHTIRESLRLHAPVTSTMRVSLHDAVIPLSPNESFVDIYGQEQREIRLKKGDIISVPIQALNKLTGWGGDGETFRPERWEEGGGVGYDDEDGEKGGWGGRKGKGKGVQGLWGNMLTFLNGQTVNGNRACIGYRFAINEIKIFLYVLLRDIEFSIDPSIEIEKKVNVVTRPCVKSEPHLGNQMPLYMRYIPPDSDIDIDIPIDDMDASPTSGNLSCHVCSSDLNAYSVSSSSLDKSASQVTSPQHPPVRTNSSNCQCSRTH